MGVKTSIIPKVDFSESKIIVEKQDKSEEKRRMVQEKKRGESIFKKEMKTKTTAQKDKRKRLFEDIVE